MFKGKQSDFKVIFERIDFAAPNTAAFYSEMLGFAALTPTYPGLLKQFPHKYIISAAARYFSS
jgi:hypothetical protein